MSTISRALVSIKHFNQQFTKFLSETKFSGVSRKGVEISTGKKVNEFTEESRKAIQSAKDKIKSDFELRCKVNTANNTTKVKVGKQEMTISEALIYRTHTLPYIKNLRDKMYSSYISSLEQFKVLDIEFSNKILQQTNEDMKALLEKTERPTVIDIKKDIDELDEMINFFDLEFDAILTETNPQVIV